MTDQKIRVDERLADLPPSCKLVYVVLQEAGPLTKRDLVERTDLSPKSVYNALQRLDRETDLLDEQPNLTDARQTLYEVGTDSRDSNS